MSENSPELVMNGHGGPIAGSLSQADVASAQQASVTDQGAAEPERTPALIDDLCRLTVCGPDCCVELAVPVHVPLIDLLPALVGHLGDGLADAGLERGGWVLQRLGDPPLQEDLSVAALGLRDGDVVHLRPRSDQLPPLDFDDLIDGIAVGISGRSDRWRPEMSRRLLTALIVAPLAAGLIVLAAHPSALAALLAATLTLILLAATAAASRAYSDKLAASVLGGAVICYAALAAGELPLLRGAGLAGAAGSGGNQALIAAITLRPALLASGVAMAGATAAVSLVRGGRHPVLVAALAAALLAAFGGALATFARLGPAPVAGVLVALIVPLSGWVPMISFRLTGLRLDPPPSTPEELQADLDPLPGQQLLERTRLADRYMTALYGGLAVMLTSCLIVLGLSPGLPAQVVAIDLIVLLLLHSRVLVAARHRLAAVIPAAAGATTLAAAAGLSSGRDWPLLVVGLAAVAGLLLVSERSLPGHKLLPHWGRAGDVLHTLSAAALIPAVAWLLNLYQYARTVHG